MNDFGLFFEMGYQHIADLKGIDHILFVLVLCIRYQFADWKKLLWLITAFTIGHSITLALSVFNILNYSTSWIEFLIPVTILITAISNVFVKKFVYKAKFPLIYFFALFFGLIHGLGFSNYLKSLLSKGENIVPELLAFNLGLEAGQLLIVLSILFISLIFVNLFKVNRREYILFITGGVFAIALQMALERIPF
ncbi:MAG: HupE / UreJ protein [Sphingobacteriia bacterium 24-36-13]|jgi:ABC-type antimicrobial peptide transport system permease subunit|uniref:HupE/UreJ family protein n=1 Tax=Sediminibacterium sp. TaxID=1917865 RepID=UPI000BD70546|nr:HupE/UreJ family protein [Sediminibacterium sp.]OYY10746.1 MAG: HupE / UreJ protein [Sphingobacteriia bacterium 35-36-14]OYZ55606.1 MAG: HupE / UreJ protein [Sphingobacteriia bacterium 24-36-13]OZA64657.1 MAG: HupE / UreJ protein [Sphingobacteriia bacterium 39-36-14]MBT9484742.1 HupE/UreJ family protein [Sediminibacterium sp.]HQS23321.1 HupE/UreJ family protein [Sediminibacterium sp.]